MSRSRHLMLAMINAAPDPHGFFRAVQSGQATKGEG
jgi:hypothetical protein